MAEARVISLRREAERCGGVIAALLTNIRSARRGEEIKIVDAGQFSAELVRALKELESYGIIRIIYVGEGEASIVKAR